MRMLGIDMGDPRVPQSPLPDTVYDSIYSQLKSLFPQQERH